MMQLDSACALFPLKEFTRRLKRQTEDCSHRLEVVNFQPKEKLSLSFDSADAGS